MKFSKPNFSKSIVVFSIIQFFYVFVTCLNKIDKMFNSEIIFTDTSFYVASIGISGTIFATTVIWYMKKSTAEKATQFQVQNLKEILELKKQYKDDEELLIMCADAESECIDRIDTIEDNLVDESTASPEIQTNIF